MSQDAHNPPSATRPAVTWAICIGLFLLAWLLRTLFSEAGPDAHWPHSVYYKGDVFVWLRAVIAERTGQVFEVGLPMRPPAMIWLLDVLWDGTPDGMAFVKTIWRVMGAATVALFYLPLQRNFGQCAGLVASAFLALGFGGLLIAGSVNNETPYLLAVALTMAVQPQAVWQPSQEHGKERLRWLAWGVLNGIACLVRVEHLLFFVVVLAFALLAGRRKNATKQNWQGLTLALASFVLCLVPWHLEAWAMIENFNQGKGPQSSQSEAAIAFVESQTPELPWTADALQAAAALPGFIRRSSKGFIAATVHHRGGTQVDMDGVATIKQAFGSLPEPVGSHPFVSAYGPLNFYLANNEAASTGFSRAGLERPPPLEGGKDSYPAMLVQGLPPSNLAFEYPPHLEVFNHGYAMGARWIASHPLDWLGLAVRKLGIFWRGASTGFGGDNLPLGPNGTRRAVDIVSAEHTGASVWRLLIAVAVLLGLWDGLQRTSTRYATLCLALYGISKLAIAVLFFGYARQGVLITPVVYLALALALCRWVAPWLGRHAFRAAVGLLLILVAMEGARRAQGIQVTLDGSRVLQIDPVPVDEHRDRELRFK